MKYNVGDKVVKENDLKFLFNPFWKKDYREGLIKTVTEANEKEFTYYNDKGRSASTLENGHSCGMNNYLIYFQSSGKQWSYPNPERLLHLEKDKDYIIDKIKTLGREFYEENIKSIDQSINTYMSMKERFIDTYNQDLEINFKILE